MAGIGDSTLFPNSKMAAAARIGQSRFRSGETTGVQGSGSGDGSSFVGTWVTTYSETLNIDTTGWNGFNLRQYIQENMLSANGSAVRFTLQAALTAGCSIGSMWVGHQALSGDVYDMAASSPTPVQIKVSGSGSFSLSASTSVVTDPVSFAFDQARNLIVACYFNAVSTVRGYDFSPSVIVYSKSGADESSVADVTGYGTGFTSQIRLISKIEVLQP